MWFNYYTTGAGFYEINYNMVCLADTFVNNDYNIHDLPYAPKKRGACFIQTDYYIQM